MEATDVRRTIEIDGQSFDYPLHHIKEILGIFRNNSLLAQVQFDLIAYRTPDGLIQRISRQILIVAESDLRVVKLAEPILTQDCEAKTINIPTIEETKAQ